MTTTEDPKDPQDPKDPKDPKPGDDQKNKNGGHGNGEGDSPDGDDTIDEAKAWEIVKRSRRFKSITERAQLGDKLQKEQEANERKKLEADGKLKELAEKERQRAEAAESRLAEMTRKGSISAAAVKAGFVDPNDAPALIDPSKVETDDEGNVTNADALVAELAKAKPHLVGKKPDLGGAGAGGGDTPTNAAGKRWKQSEIRKLSSDPENGMKWWEDNKKDILAAQHEGRIDYDA